MLIYSVFEESVQFQLLPQLQAEPAGAKLPCALQAHLVQQHARYLWIIRWWLHLRREKLQLLRLTLLIEDFNRL